MMDMDNFDNDVSIINSSSSNNTRITGVMVQYYTACKTELWYFANHISYNDEDENIKIGKLIHKKSFTNEKKDILIDNCISIDYIKTSAKKIVIHEVKKSSKLDKPVKDQVLYYLYYLKQKGIETSAIINYPKERKKEKISLTNSDEERIKTILEDIKFIIEKDKPPPPVKKPYCKRCSYYQFCWC